MEYYIYIKEYRKQKTKKRGDRTYLGLAAHSMRQPIKTSNHAPAHFVFLFQLQIVSRSQLDWLIGKAHLRASASAKTVMCGS
jgi:hypothetical protein